MAKSAVKITKSGYNLEQWAAMQQPLKEFAFMVQRDLVVSNPHGRPAEPRDETGKFHINFFSIPVSKHAAVNWRSPGYVFDIELSGGQASGIAATPTGKLVLDDNGTVVGIVAGQSLFILFDLPHGGNNQWTTRMLKRILERALPLILTADQIKERMDLWRKERSSSSREDYAKICMGRHGKQLEKLKKDLRVAKDRNELIQKQYIEHVRHLSQLETAYRLHKDSAGKMVKSRLTNEYDKMIKFPGVSSVFVNDREIVVETISLNSQKLKDDSVRVLGQYRLTIGVDDGTINIMNVTPNKIGRVHPHVDGYGRPCLGNIGESLLKLIAAYEFAAVVDIMLKYIQTINEGDANGATVYRWPKATDLKKAAKR